MVRAPSEITDEAPEVQYTEDLFVYAVDFPLLAANGSVDANIQIEADSYFKWIKGTYFAYQDGNDPDFTASNRDIPGVKIQITDSGSGRQLFNVPIFVSTIFGIGELPMINPLPRIFKPRSNISFSAQNLSSAVDWRISLDLIGVKGFKGKG